MHLHENNERKEKKQYFRRLRKINVLRDYEKMLRKRKILIYTNSYKGIKMRDNVQSAVYLNETKCRKTHTPKNDVLKFLLFFFCARIVYHTFDVVL